MPGWQDELGEVDDWPDMGTAPALPADLAGLDVDGVPSSLRLPTTDDAAATGTVRSTGSQVTGTLVLHADADAVAAGPPSQLAWAVAAANGGGAGGKGPRDMFSPLKLEMMFNPPTLPRPPTASTPFEPRSSTPKSSDAGTMPEPELPSLQAQPFSFTAKRDPTSWRSRPHFLGDDEPVAEIPSSQVSFEDTPSRPPPAPAAPQLKLFQFTYDTYTRSHLEALVDEIDHFADTGAGPSASRSGVDEANWRDSLSGECVEASHVRADEAEDAEERPITRSAKRIRLSPVHERSVHELLVPPTTLPRSAVRDRIRARREAAGGMTTQDDPTVSPTLSRSYARRPVDTPIVVPPTPTLSTASTGADRVNARLQQAQALMDRIRSNAPAPDTSLGSTLTSSQARSSPLASASSSGSVGSGFGPGPPVLPAYDPPLVPSRLGAPLAPVMEVETEDEGMSERSIAPLPSFRPRNPTPLHAAGAYRTTSHSTATETATVQGTLGARTVSDSTTLTSAPSTGSQLKRSAESNAALAEQRRAAASAQVEAALRASLAESPRPFARSGSSRNLALSSLGVGQPSEPVAPAPSSKAAHPSIITIAPHQVLPDVIDTAAAQTRMVFDAQSRCWVRAADASEEDIFKDIDNFSASAAVADHLLTPENEERPVVEAGAEDEDEDTGSFAKDGEFTEEQVQPPVVLSPVPLIVEPSNADPMLSTPNPERPPLRPRSALKSRSDPLVFPHAVADTPRSNSSSPPDSAKRRSVSFSDRRIIVPRAASEPLAGPSRLRHEIRTDEPTGTHSDADGDESREEVTSEPSPLSKAGGASGSSGELSSRAHRLEVAMADFRKLQLDGSHGSSDGSVFTARQPSVRMRPRAGSKTGRTGGDATFLTECSFGVAHDRLVAVITDVHPFEPNWESLASIDLSHKGLSGVVRLKEFLPQLDELDLAHNEIAYLTGMPDCLRTLRLGHNAVSSLASFGHLVNLERLDLSSNDLDSVKQLSCLRHLRELKADNNRIDDLTGLADLDGLVRLSLKGNRIARLDLGSTKWTRLETLNVSANRIAELSGLDRMASLVSLNLDGNQLAIFGGAPNATVRVLRLSDNPLVSLDVQVVPALRTLVADRCRLKAVPHLGKLRKLETISLGGQSTSLELQSHAIRDVRRIFLAGCALRRSIFGTEAFLSLVQLDLSACRLDTLPPNLAVLIPNCRSLALDANFLTSLAPLHGLVRLRELTATGNRVARCRSIADLVATLPELRSLDVRSNPCTLSFYAAVNGAGTTDDAAYRRTLPDAWYLRRMAYRAAVVVAGAASTALRTLDAVPVGTTERKLMPDMVKRLDLSARAMGLGGFEALLESV